MSSNAKVTWGSLYHSNHLASQEHLKSPIKEDVIGRSRPSHAQEMMIRSIFQMQLLEILWVSEIYEIYLQLVCDTANLS